MSLFTQKLLVSSASFNIKFPLLINNYYDCLVLAPARFVSLFSPPTQVFLCFFQHLSAFSCFGAFVELHLHDSYMSALLTTPFPVLFNRSVVSNSLWSRGLQHARLPCPLPSPVACSNSCLLSQWSHPTISSSVILFFSCSQSFPASGSFPMSQFFASGGQSIGASASASVLPMNIQDWLPLGWTGLISLQSKGLSRVFSKTTVQKHQFFSAQLSSQSNSHIHIWR